MLAQLCAGPAPQTLRLLLEHGLLGSVLAHAYPIWRMGMFDKEGRHAQIAFDQQNQYSCLAVLPQSYLEELLEQALREEGVEVQWQHEAVNPMDTEEGVRVTINRLEPVQWGYVVAHEEWTGPARFGHGVPRGGASPGVRGVRIHDRRRSRS